MSGAIREADLLLKSLKNCLNYRLNKFYNLNKNLISFFYLVIILPVFGSSKIYELVGKLYMKLI